MPIRTITTTASLDACWREHTFTTAMLSDPDTASLASHFGFVDARIESLGAGQRAKWRDEVIADARVAQADRALDLLTNKLSSELLHLDGQNRDTPRFKLYFKKSPSLVTKLALAAQLEVCQNWPATLTTEPEASLKALATEFTNVIALGKGALQGREAAQVATAVHRAREILPFIDDFNAARQTVYGQLSSIAGQTRKPRGWAESFFRVAETEAPSEPS
ncbi:MAG: hypothetical protein GQE15_36295 [Archangiaceae bacterium]|nr:hypothetical protein [Archangiaceae bacterium]